jgi:hypothetical protein
MRFVREFQKRSTKVCQRGNIEQERPNEYGDQREKRGRNAGNAPSLFNEYVPSIYDRGWLVEGLCDALDWRNKPCTMISKG